MPQSIDSIVNLFGHETAIDAILSLLDLQAEARDDPEYFPGRICGAGNVNRPRGNPTNLDY